MQPRPRKPCKPLPSTPAFTSSLFAAPFQMHNHVNPIDLFLCALKTAGRSSGLFDITIILN